MTELMQLAKLKALRDTVSTSEFPIPTAELCARYEALYTGAVNDVLREFLLMDQALPHTIVPLREEMKVAGIAFTIRSVKDPTVGGEMETRARMLEAIHEDAICVWDTAGDEEAAHWGEMMTATARQRGARGAVVDGGLRDTCQVLAQRFPIWYRYRSSNGSLGRCKITAYQVPILIGKVIIRPGDVVFADIDGALVIPRDIACDVLVRAEEIRSAENSIRQWAEAGVSASEIVGRGGYF